MNERALYFATLISIACPCVTARDLVVDNVSGSDLQNDRGLVAGSVSFGPYRTITRALIAAKKSDSIILTNTGVPYRECVSLTGNRHSGTAMFPFRIIGNGATLDGSRPARKLHWELHRDGIYRYMEPRYGYAQLFLAGKTMEHFRLPGDLGKMKPQQWTHRDGYVYYRPPEKTSPFDFALEVTTEAMGISLYDVEHVIISGLTVRGYRLDGINAHDKANEIQIMGVAARHNGRSGISIGGSSTVTVGGTRCEHNGVAQLRTEGQSHTFLSNVKLAPGSAVDIQREGGEILKLADR